MMPYMYYSFHLKRPRTPISSEFLGSIAPIGESQAAKGASGDVAIADEVLVGREHATILFGLQGIPKRGHLPALTA